MIGRDSERKAIREFVQSHRWITIHGPMGVGKTTLSRDVASTVSRSLFADLSASNRQADIVKTIAVLLELPLREAEPDEIRAQVAGAISATLDLIVLDNFEQVMHCVPLVEYWFEHCPETTFVVTSREPLKSEWEHVFELGPMGRDDARALFIARAKRVARDFDESSVELSTFDELLNALDHLPLAIELAAARSSVLTPRGLLERLADRFAILKSKNPKLTPRQSTLRGAIAWSWDLLSDAERSALVALTPFRDSFSLVDVEGVGVSLDELETLIEKSLVRRNRDSEFFVLQSVRAFAEAESSSEENDAAVQHMAHTVATQCDAFERRSELVAFVAKRYASISWAFRKTTDETDRMNLFVALDRYQTLRGTIAERDHLVRLAHFNSPAPELSITASAVALARGRSQSAIDLGEYAAENGLPIRGRLAVAKAYRHDGRVGEARKLCESLVEVSNQSEDSELGIEVLSVLGSVQMADPEIAIETFKEALTIAKDRGFSVESARVLNAIGAVETIRGDYAAARSAYERALTFLEKESDVAIEGALRSNLGLISQYLDDLEAAREAFREARKNFQRIGYRKEAAIVLGNLGDVETALGNYDAAQRALDDAHLDIEDDVARGVVEVALGTLYHLRGNLGVAKKWYDTALISIDDVSHPHHRSARWFSGMLSLQRDEIDACVATMRSLTDYGDVSAALANAILCELGHATHQQFEQSQAALLNIPPAIANGLAWVDALLRGNPQPVPDKWPVVQVIASIFVQEDLACDFLLHEDGLWFERDGERVDISRRGPARSLLLAIVNIGLGSEPKPLDLDSLFEIGWPDESIHPESAHKRVYAAIGTLRRLGLEAVILTTDDGYILNPELRAALSK